MQTLLFAFIIMGLCFIGFGVGVLFFGRDARASECGTVPEAAHEDCPSQKAGLCPIEDTTGALKLLNQTKLNHRPR